MDCITYPESLFIGPKFALYSKKYSDENSDYWTTDCRCMGDLCCVCIENGFPPNQKLSHKGEYTSGTSTISCSLIIFTVYIAPYFIYTAVWHLNWDPIDILTFTTSYLCTYIHLYCIYLLLEMSFIWFMYRLYRFFCYNTYRLLLTLYNCSIFQTS